MKNQKLQLLSENELNKVSGGFAQIAMMAITGLIALTAITVKIIDSALYPKK